jgi:hypothetical protein
MPTLIERLDAQIDALLVERQRIRDQTVRDLAVVDEKVAALRDAKAAITADVETSYNRLRALGIFKEF